MSEFDRLLSVYRERIRIPWQTQLSAPERVWMLVYPSDLERRVRRGFGDFKRETEEAGKRWQQIDLLSLFPIWMASHEFRESYFSDPSLLEQDAFKPLESVIVTTLHEKLYRADAYTMTAVLGAASLFGFVRLSTILDLAHRTMKGRLLVCFPGAYGEHSYRLLDARSSYNYQASPLTTTGGFR